MFYTKAQPKGKGITEERGVERSQGPEEGEAVSGSELGLGRSMLIGPLQAQSPDTVPWPGSPRAEANLTQEGMFLTPKGPCSQAGCAGPFLSGARPIPCLASYSGMPRRPKTASLIASTHGAPIAPREVPHTASPQSSQPPRPGVTMLGHAGQVQPEFPGQPACLQAPPSLGRSNLPSPGGGWRREDKKGQTLFPCSAAALLPQA